MSRMAVTRPATLTSGAGSAARLLPGQEGGRLLGGVGALVAGG